VALSAAAIDINQYLFRNQGIYTHGRCKRTLVS